MDKLQLKDMQKIPLLTGAALFAAATTVAQGALTTTTVFDSGAITAANGYTTAGLGGQGGTVGVGTFSAPGAYQVNTTAGNARNFSGTVPSAAFGRVIVSEAIDLEAQDVIIGDMITIQLSGLTVLSDTTDDSVLQIGLSPTSLNGGGIFSIGSILTRSGTDLLANGVDTSFNIGTDKFNYGVKLTAETAGNSTTATYTIEHMINGVALAGATQTGQTPATVTAGGFRGWLMDTDGNAATNAAFTFEGFSVNTIAAAVPEPSTGLLGLLGLGLLARRKRR